MFAEINVKLLEPNVLYLDEKPPKIFKTKKPPKKRLHAKTRSKKTDIVQQMKVKAKKSKTAVGHKLIIKKESPVKALEMGDQIKDAIPGEDPLYTPDKEIKMETDLEHGADDFENKLLEHQIPDDDIKYNDLGKEAFSVDDEEEYEAKHEPEVEDELEFEDDGEDDDYDDEYIDSADDDQEDDEPLIMLTRSKGRPRKYSLKDNGRNKKPRIEKCRHVCKQKCNQKFTEEQRRSMCALFWSLSEEGKVQYIRNHIRTRFIRLKRKKLTNRGNNNCYYLDDDNTECTSLIRVCRKYFENTLCLSNYTVKKALEGCELDIEIEVKPLIEQQNDQKKSIEKSGKEIQQYLDPETGNLETIDPKAKKPKKSDTTTPKKKRIRRKPGDPLPEHNPKPIKCAQRCIHKCHTKFTEEERKKICDIFWSMDYKRRKDFILARIETRDILTETTPEFRKTNRPPRAYHTRFFLGSGLNGENKRVCKHFLMATLSITRMFITNAIDFADKNTGCYTGTDRRGLHFVPNKIAPDVKKIVTDHIGSYPTWVPKTKGKNRYLHHTLTIKRMYMEYKEMCLAKQVKSVSINLYYRSFHEDFSLYFLSNPEPQKGKGLINLNPNISPYTGDEPGGVWLDPEGGNLDLKVHHPADSFMCFHSRPQSMRDADPEDLAPISTVVSTSTTAAQMSSASTSSFSFNQTLSYAHIIDPTLNSSIRQSQVMRQEFNPNLYDTNIQQSHITGTSSLFRRL